MTKKKFNCPAEMTISLIGGRWKAIIMYNLRKGAKRFGEIKRLSPGITSATLALQLKELERHRLSEKGESLKPVLYAMIRWGIAHQDDYVVGGFGMAKFSRTP